MRAAHLTITARDRSLPLYLVTVGLGEQRPVERQHGCPDFHWLHTVAGRGIVQMESSRRTLSPGQGFLMYPHTPCTYWPDDSWNVMWLTFNGSNVEGFLRAWGLPPRFVDLPDPKAPASGIRQMLAATAPASDYTSARLSSMLYEFLVELSWQASRDKDILLKRQRIEPVLQILDEDYGQPLTLDAMAAAIAVTPQHLCRPFQAVMGMTPWNYLTALRITKAKDLLADTGHSVAAIAAAAGFGNTSHFCTVFRRHVGLTPSQFRSRHGSESST